MNKFNIEYNKMDFDEIVNTDIEEEILDGYGEYYNPYNVPLYKGFFKNGKPHGQCKYYVCGELDYDGQWEHGLHNGHGKKYDEFTYYEGEFKDNLYNGEGIIYYNNGNIKLEGNFIDGLVNGYAKKFYENGNLQYEGEFSNNKYSGKGKLYNESGTLLKEGEFINGTYIDENLMDKEHLKAFSIMKYIKSYGRECDTNIKGIVEEVTDNKPLNAKYIKTLCDIVIDMLKDSNTSKSHLITAEAYSRKGAKFRKQTIIYLEKFLSNNHLELSDFDSDNRIMDGNMIRDIEDYEKDKELIDKTIIYLKKQIRSQLVSNYISEKMYDKAIEMSEEDIKYKNNDYKVYVNIADVYEKKKDYIKVEEFLNKAISAVKEAEKLSKRALPLGRSKADLIYLRMSNLYLKQYGVEKAYKYLESLNETPFILSIKETFKEKHKL